MAPALCCQTPSILPLLPSRARRALWAGCSLGERAWPRASKTALCVLAPAMLRLLACTFAPTPAHLGGAQGMEVESTLLCTRPLACGGTRDACAQALLDCTAALNAGSCSSCVLMRAEIAQEREERQTERPTQGREGQEPQVPLPLQRTGVQLTARRRASYCRPTIRARPTPRLPPCAPRLPLHGCACVHILSLHDACARALLSLSHTHARTLARSHTQWRLLYTWAGVKTNLRRIRVASARL